MESKVVSIIVKAFTACSGWLEDLIAGIPGAKTAIFWALFVGLIMSFLIIPIRGFGAGLGMIDYTINQVHKEKRKSYANYKANRQRKESYAKRYKAGE